MPTSEPLMSEAVELPSMGYMPRWYQTPLWSYIQNGGRRACVVWPRRHGKDITMINLAAVMSQMRVGVYWHVFPYLNQARRAIWNGRTKEGVPFMDAFPEPLIKNKSNHEMSLYLKNDSVYQIMGADDPNRLVGSNPVGVIFSEWALMDPNAWKLISPILAENDGWAVFIFTPRGENHGLDTLNEAKRNKNWFWSHETAVSLKVLSPGRLQEARDELGDEALFQQEMMTSFETPVQGAYYAKQMRRLSKDKRITEVPIDTRLPVHTAWDLGMNDETTIWFFQQYRAEVRIVDYYANSGESLAHYAQVLKRKSDEAGYTYGDTHLPHDVVVREMGTGKTRLDTLRDLGIRGRAGPKLPIEDGIEAVRNLLPRCWFDRTKTHEGLNALRSYTKEWDTEKATYKNRPLHNWASHAADSFRYLAIAIKDKMIDKSNRQADKAENDWDPFDY